MALKYVQTPAVALYTGVSATATSIRITPFPVDLDGTKLTMSDFGTKGYATIDPKISGYEEIISFTGLTDNGDNTGTLTGVTRSLGSKSPYTTTSNGKIHGSSAVVVFSDNPQLFADLYDYINTAVAAGGVPATTSVAGISIEATQAQIDADTGTSGSYELFVNPAKLVLSKYGTRLPTAAEKTLLTALTASMPGVISPYAGRTAPTGWLLCDGSAISRTTYTALFGIVCPTMTFTVTIASPAVFTATAHGFVAGDRIHLTTTGGLPSGLSLNTYYYVISTGLTANAFQVALSPGGTAINTSGSQSGVHTLYMVNYGKGDGSTTFNVPDLRSRTALGLGAGTATLDVEAALVSAASDTFTLVDNEFPYQGQAVTLTSTGTLPAGLSLATTYYVIRASTTTIKFATNQANANDATAINITDAGTGVHTINFTHVSRTVIGKSGGEDSHALSQTEMPSHEHTYGTVSAAFGGGGNQGSTTGTGSVTGTNGADTVHNNMSPYLPINYIIKT